jgi:catechol 2,3-dioxygenase-like lactoylglutathione lyase family enzyme
MDDNAPEPVARLTMVTLGVSNMRASIAFYEALGFMRRFKATGEVVAFFDTGGTAIGLFPWDQLAKDVTLPESPRPQAFRGMTGFRCLKGRLAVETCACDGLWRLFRIFCRSGQPSLGSRGRPGN